MLSFNFAEITWVCGEIGQVSLDVYNPFPFELKVSNMVSIKLRAENNSHSVVYVARIPQ